MATRTQIEVGKKRNQYNFLFQDADFAGEQPSNIKDVKFSHLNHNIYFIAAFLRGSKTRSGEQTRTLLQILFKEIQFTHGYFITALPDSIRRETNPQPDPTKSHFKVISIIHFTYRHFITVIPRPLIPDFPFFHIFFQRN